ncbi:MAG: ribonuclease Z, partial [Nanoarchaeota archaeon]
MEKIQIIFLGTGSAIPTITRNHTSIFLKYKDRNILVDCGEGTQRQIRKAKLNPRKITDILITHFHGDHVFGLPGLLHTLSQLNYNRVLNIYGPKGINEFIKKIFSFAEIKIPVKIREATGIVIDTKEFKIIAFPLNHDIPCNGYRFEEKSRLRIKKEKFEKLIKKLKINSKDLNKIQELLKKKNIHINNKILKWNELTYLEKGRKVGFVLDTELCNNVARIIENTELSVIEAAFLENENINRKYKHLTLEQAVKTAKNSKVKKLILTHISQRYEFKENELLKKARKIFKNVEIAKDLMR